MKSVKSSNDDGDKQVRMQIELSPRDYEDACAAAKSVDESVAQWISSLVNTALQP
jgi:predicted HicB family RNase H-like nuclease